MPQTGHRRCQVMLRITILQPIFLVRNLKSSGMRSPAEAAAVHIEVTHWRATDAALLGKCAPDTDKRAFWAGVAPGNPAAVEDQRFLC